MTTIQPHQREDLWGYAKRLRFVRESISAAFPDAPALRVLDIGCGNGSQLALPLAEDARLQITGIDPDARSIQHAKTLAGTKGNLNFIRASVAEVSPDSSFDVIILSEVLEHLEQPQRMLQEAVNLLDRNGLLVITVPNGYGEFEIDSWIFRLLRLQKLVNRFARHSEALAATDNAESGHVQFFTRRRLTRLFDDAGLRLVNSGASSFLAGPVIGHFIGRSQRLIEWNSRITDRLPLMLASGWYFSLRRGEMNRTGTMK